MQIDVYSVRLLDLLELPGSGRHEDLLDIIREECSFVDEIDGMIDEYHAMNTGPAEEHVSFLEAVRQIHDGKPLTAKPAFIYANAYEAICFGLGDTLCNVMNYFQHPLDDLDQFLSQSSIPLRFKDLRYAGPLLDIPNPGDYPFMGWWTSDQICRAITPLRQLSLDGVDPALAADVAKIRDWLENAIDHDGDCIIGFEIG
ncbi:MAG TPA: hypothetical protein VH575_08410 [Gemmataceae bacterium]|jgi:hypothetical protein